MTPDDLQPPIREFADRGTLWLLESPENLHGLVQLVAADIAEQLNFSRAERINRSFIPHDLHKQEADLVYRVPFGVASRQVWVYVLLEHQSKPDPFMGLRLLSYMVALWETQRRGWRDARTPVGQRRLQPIIPMVFYTGSKSWRELPSVDAAMNLPASLSKFVPRHDTLFLKLRETSPERLGDSAIGWALRVMQVEDTRLDEMKHVLAEAVRALDDLPQENQAEWLRAMHYMYLLIHHRRSSREFNELGGLIEESVQRHRKEVQEMKQSYAQTLIAKGRKEGREEGRNEAMKQSYAQTLIAQGRKEGHKEGREETRIEMLVELLDAKFGPLPENLPATLAKLSSSRIQEIFRAALSANSLVELNLER